MGQPGIVQPSPRRSLIESDQVVTKLLEMAF